MTRRLRVVLCLLAFLPFAYAAGKDRITELDFVGSAWVDVDAKGHGRVEQVDSVTKLDNVPALAPAVARIKEVLKQRIESWEFIPATRDGIAVPSRTYLSVEMEGMDDGKGGLGIRILSAHGGPQGELTPPPYPPTAYRNGIQGGVFVSGGNDQIRGGNGNDQISGNGGNDQITGDIGDDILYGGSENDCIFGGDGNDSLYGGDGDDDLIGGLGKDIFTCGKGNDVVHDFIELEGDSVNDDCETIIS